LTDGFSGSKTSLALSTEELREVARLARELQTAGYPLLATGKYLDLLERDPGLHAYGCRAPYATLTVKADGSVRDCTRRDVTLASVVDLHRAGGSLATLTGEPSYRAMLARARSCTACNNPDILETSWVWQLRPFMLRRALSLGIG
jgi:hypothetical protein